MTEDREIAELLRGLEEEMLNAGVRRDPGRLDFLLADTFTEFGSSGQVFTKGEIIAALRVEVPQRLRLLEFRAVRLAEDVFHVTYRSMRDDAHAALRSSVWVRRAGQWRILFHQGTRVPPGGADIQSKRTEQL